MNLTTQYLGLKLKNPLVVGASPFGDNTYMALELQDAGASALVMRSLFEEQVDAEQRALVHHLESTANSHPEGTSYFPNFDEYQLAPDQYLRQLGQLKSSLTIPVIASLNGCRPGGWTDYARRLESAGADAIELNLYQLATDPDVAADEVEADLLQTVRNAVEAVRIPLAVKISSFHTAPVHFAKALEGTGVAGIVLFNRFYQPDFNLEELEVQPQLRLSDSSELLLRLRWLAILSPRVRCSLAASGGVHQAEDVVKALLAGADTVQVVSALLKNGPKFLSILIAGLRHWMNEHGYESIGEVRGAMNLRHCPNPAAFERANYQRILQSWRI